MFVNQDLQQALIAKATSKLRLDIVSGTVVDGPMLTVQRDDGMGRILQPSTVLHSPAVGEKVWVLTLGNFNLILGAQKGRDPNTLVVDGKAYPRSGKLVASRGATTTNSYGLSYASMTFPTPFEPPDGWEFQVVLASNVSGYIWGTLQSQSKTAITVRTMGTYSNSSPVNLVFQWTLIKSD